LKPKGASKDRTEFAEVVSLIDQIILFALEENAIHQPSEPEDPSTVPNPHWFGPPTDNPHRHHWKEEQLLICTQETTRAKLE
jgi:hypothetical protein